MNKQEKRAKENESDPSESDDADADMDSDEINDSFIADSDEDDDASLSYGRRPLLDDDDDDYEDKASRKKKKKDKKKKDKKDKKKKKKKKHHDDEDYDDSDLALIDENEENNFRRLRKKKREEKPANDDDDQDYSMEDDIGPDEDDVDEGDMVVGPGRYDSEDEYSRPNEVIKANNGEEADLSDLFDQKVLRQYYQEPKDKEIVEIDLPERQILRYKSYAKMWKLSIEEVKAHFEKEDRKSEAKWIFDKLKQQGHFDTCEERECLKKIENVLNALNQEHLEIMYIYYYRKKIWADELNLSLLIKIEEIDQEWLSFKKDYQEIKKDFEEVIPSFTEVPRSLEDAFSTCTDSRFLKYFKDYTQFVLTKHQQSDDSKSNTKTLSIIRQMVTSGLLEDVQKMNVFLPPHYLCLNFRNRIQEKKPKTPHTQPDKAFRRILRDRLNADDDKRKPSRQYDEKEEEEADKRHDWSSMLLMAPDKRILTVCTYMALELFNYPELRKVLKEKYYKRLVISTNPTVKGAQNINLYSSFFPVKRIKEKPVSTLDKEVWVLATQAEKMGLITVELKLEWELSAEYKKNLESDTVYLELVKYYFDVSSHESGEVWNVFRKQVLIKMLTDYFIPSFLQEVREDLTRDGHKKIIEAACQKFKSQLNKGPSLKEEKPIKILAMVLEKDKLGMAFVDEQGNDHFPLCMQIFTDEDLKRFASQSVLDKYIDQHKPDMILIAANCRRAQTLRKELRNPNLFPEPIYCAFGEYEVPNLMANKKKMNGVTTEKTILEAISMARLKKNPMAQILGLWADSIDDNGVLSMNLHPLQRCVNKRKLRDALEKVAIQMVNLVGLDINELLDAEHCRNQLQFISGLGPRKAYDLLNRIKSNSTGIHSKVHERKDLLDFCSGKEVYRNCSPFLKIVTPEHLEIIERYDTDRRKTNDLGVKLDRNLMKLLCLLDMTRIPEEWYEITKKMFMQAVYQNVAELKSKKFMKELPDHTLAILEMFKHPEKLRQVEWESRKDSTSVNSQYYDENLIKNEIMNRFKDTRDPEKVMENRDIFYSLLRETPETLRKYMVVTAKILSAHKQALNVVIQENGLFGNIKIYENKPEYEKGNFIKAVITGFPFDEGRKNNRFEDDQELLKVEMSLSFPHKTDERGHDCMSICFPAIVKEIHPQIDLEKENFDLRKEDKPVIEVKEEMMVRPRTDTRRINHVKFKNITLPTAVEEVRNMPIGQFLIRPSTEGADYLTVTWHFYKGIIAHIKLRSEQKNISNTNCVYRILDKDKDKIFNTIDEVIEKHIKPMNAMVQDVISNKKFLPAPLEQIEERVRLDVGRDSSTIHYFFGCSPQYPQFFILVYIYKEKKPIKEPIRVRSGGLFFHENMFQSLRELIAWFKEHLKDKEYQRFARASAIRK